MQSQNNNPKEQPFNWEEYKKQELAGEENKENVFANRTFESNERSSVEKEDSYQSTLAKVKTTSSQNNNDDQVKDEADYVFQKRTRDEQVKHLVDLALDKGVTYAVKVAKKTDDLYVLDRLHDTLVEEDLHQTLVKKGLINE